MGLAAKLRGHVCPDNTFTLLCRLADILYRNPTSECDIVADDAVTRHFFNGFIRLHILYHAAKEPTYGAEITEELIRHGYRISQGTLYPTFHLLEKLGYLESRQEVVAGRRRKYYRATATGKRVLAEAREKLLELVAEVVEDHDEPFRVIQEKRRHRHQPAPKKKRPHP